MAVKLRLRRMGRSKRPVYSVIATDARSPRDGRFIEDLGRYNPIQEPAETSLNRERLLYWLEQGAQPSETVRSLLSKDGVMLEFAMQRKGKSKEEITAAVEAHKTARAQKAAATMKLTPGARRKQALEAERKRVAEEEAKRRVEAEAEAKRQAEERQRAQEAAAQQAAEQEAAAAEQTPAPADEAASDEPVTEA